MRTRVTIISPCAFSRLDLTIAMAIGIVLAMVFLPALSDARRKAQRIHCISNLKHIGLSFQVWASDEGRHGIFPHGISTNAGGTADFTTSDATYRHFQIISNELVSAGLLVCSTDSRHPATSFDTLSSLNLSYMLSLGAVKPSPDVILTGDRNLLIDGETAVGCVEPGTNSTMSWSSEMHHNAGNIAFADGSVQQVTSAELAGLVRDGTATNRFLFP